MKRALLTLGCLFLASQAGAQTPSPAQLGITPTTNPENLQVLDSTKTWVPLGGVNPDTHTFTPVGGGGSGGGGEVDIVVTDPTVGMASVTATTVPDNAPHISALMNKMGPPNRFVTGYDVTFPAVPGQAFTEYYFTQPLTLSRGANYHCSGPFAGSQTSLVFAPGVDGIIQEQYQQTVDGGGAGGNFDGCTVVTLGGAAGTANPITPHTLTSVFFVRDPAAQIPVSTWSVGDGLIVTPTQNSAFPYQSTITVPPGTTVTNVVNAAGVYTLDISGVGTSQYLGNVQAGSPAATATFTQTGTNNFANNDKIQVGSVTYTFASTTLGVINSVLIGPNFDVSATNLVAAIQYTTGEHTIYSGNALASYMAFSPNREVNVSYIHGSGVINFTSDYGGPAQNTLPSIYTPAGTSAGSFGGATFSGANDPTTCPAPCNVFPTASSAQFVNIWQLPATQEFKYQTNAASFTGAITTGTLTASAVTGTLAVGEYLNGTGIANNTIITSGSGTTWTVSPSQTIASEAMTAASAEIPIISGPRTGVSGLHAGDPIWADAFNFGAVVFVARAAGQFTETGTRNFQNGDTIQVGNNTFTFRTVLTAAAGDVLIGPDFATSSLYLSQGIANSPAANRGVTFNAPATASNISLLMGVGTPTLTFSTFSSTYTDGSAFPSVYTPAGASAGSFATSTFNIMVAQIRNATTVPLAPALVDHPPGSEGNLWIVPTALKRRVVASASNMNLQQWPIGASMICSSGFGSNCDGSRDNNISHYLNGVGRWASGNNYSASSAKDELFANNHIADDLELGTLGETLINPNYEDPETGRGPYGIILNCSNQNATPIFGGYTGFGNACNYQPLTSIPTPGGAPFFPPAGGGPLMIGYQDGYTTGPNFNGATFRNQSGGFSFFGGNNGAGCVNIVPGNSSWYSFGLSQAGCTTASTLGFGWQAATNKYSWVYNVTGNVMDFVISALGYTGYDGIGTGVQFPNGVLLAGDGSSSTARLLTMGASKPTGNWHMNGDTAINTASTPGGTGAWYSVGGSSSFMGVISGTTLTVQQELVTAPQLPTVATGGSGYGSGTTVSGTMTGTFAGCSTEPVLNVTASGASGAITNMVSVATKGVCSAVPATAPWTPGGALLAGTGATFNIAWQQAGQTGMMGVNQVLTGVGVTAGTKITAGSGSVWTVTPSQTVGPITISGSSWYPAMAISNDPATPDFTATTIRSGSASNKDLTGRIALVGGTATYTLAGVYASAPNCLTSDVTTPANANSVAESTTVLTFSGTGTDTLKWICAGRN